MGHVLRVLVHAPVSSMLEMRDMDSIVAYGVCRKAQMRVLTGDVRDVVGERSEVMADAA